MVELGSKNHSARRQKIKHRPKSPFTAPSFSFNSSHSVFSFNLQFFSAEITSNHSFTLILILRALSFSACFLLCLYKRH